MWEYIGKRDEDLIALWNKKVIKSVGQKLLERGGGVNNFVYSLFSGKYLAS